jgi:hypothetical protein
MIPKSYTMEKIYGGSLLLMALTVLIYAISLLGIIIPV